MKQPKNKTVYYCGPQSWPQWVRKPLSKYYNRACRTHDDHYEKGTLHEEAESEFKQDIERRRRVLRKAWKRGKVKYRTYVLHGRLFGRFMPRLTNRFGKFFK